MNTSAQMSIHTHMWYEYQSSELLLPSQLGSLLSLVSSWPPFWRRNLFILHPQPSTKVSSRFSSRATRDPPFGPYCYSLGVGGGGKRRNTMICWPAALLICPLAEGLTGGATFCRLYRGHLQELNPKTDELQWYEKEETLSDEHPQAVWHSIEGGNRG